MEPHELATVGSYPDYIQDHLARLRLEATGIEAVIEDEHTTSLGFAHGPAIGGLKLRVVESDIEAALRILYGEKKTSVAKRYRCPRCASPFSG